MKKTVDRIISVLLVTMMVISLFPVGVLSEKMKCAIPVASAKTYATGDIIEFGGYPQSRVTDSTTVDALDGLSKNWHSYSYYSGTGELSDGKMQPGDWMRYADVIYNDDKYRAVTFDTYRPDNTGYKTQYSTENTYQAANGYTVGTTYYFKWESLKWRVLNPATGLVISEKLIDSQAYQNTIYCANNYVNNEHWQNQTQSIYANDYTASSIRNWLIKDFYNSAFSFSEQVLIKEADLDNSAFSDSYSQYNSTSTTDKIFLLSYGDMINTAYGFSSSFSDNDTKRRAQGTDYAKCQGLGVYSEGDYAGNSHWRLRSPGPYSFSAAYVDYTGCVHDDDVVICTHFGVRPAFQFKSGISESANSKGGTQFTVDYEAEGGTEGPYAQTKYEGVTLELSTKIPNKSYTLTYNANRGTVSSPSITRSCIFNSWNTKTDGSGTEYGPGDEYLDDADITLYAQWEKPVAGELESPTCEGYIFDGWYTAEDGGEKVTETFEVTEDITIYAHWIEEPDEFTVRYDTNGGKGTPEDQIKTEGTDLTLREEIPVKDYVIVYDPNGGSTEIEEKTVDCTFINWNNEPDGRGTAYYPKDEYTEDADITLYAQWKNPVAGELEEPTREGYLFDGWHTAEDGGEEIAESFEVTEDITVYSHWVKELSEFTVSYDANGGVEAPEDQIKTEGTDLTLSDGIPVKDYVITYDLTDGSTENEEKTVNCSFINWNSASDGSGTAYAPGGEYSDDADVTLYAQWENPVAGVLEDPTKDGYVFDGWYTAEDGGEKIAETFEISEDVTVYAHWIPEENPDSLAGDINGDGVVNNKDLTRLMKYLSGEDVYVVKKALDVNGDGICNNKDLTRLMKYLAGVDVKIYYDKNAREFEKIYYVPVRVSTQSEAGTNEQALWQWEESNVSISLNDEKSPERVRSILFDGDGRLLSASGTDTVFEIECGVRYEFKYNDAVLDSVVRTKEPLQQMDNAADYITTSTLLFNENGLLSKYTTEEDTSFSDYLIEYDESGRVVSISGKDSGGSINFTYSYNNDRYDSAETDYYVQTDVSEYHYNEEGKLIRVEQEDGNIEYDYDEHGNVTGIKNEVIGNMEIQIEYEPATHAQYQAFLAIMNCNLDFVTPNEKITSFYRGFLMN